MPSYFHYVVAGVVIGTVAFFVGESLGSAGESDGMPRRFQTAISFALAGGAGSAVHRRLRHLREGSVSRHYLRWIASSTTAAAVVGVNELLIEQSIDALFPIVFFGLAGGVGLGVLERYVRQELIDK